MNGQPRQQISHTQFTFLVVGAILGSHIMISSIEHLLEQNSWLSVLFCIGFGLLLAWLYHAWSKTFAGNDWGDLLLSTWGKIGGRAILSLYIIGFLFIAASTTWYISDFWSSLDMPNTPEAMFIVVLVVLAACVVACGPEVIVRFCQLSVYAMVVLTVINIVLLIPQMELYNFLPIGAVAPAKFFWVTLAVFFSQYGDLFICLPFICYLSAPKRGGKAIANGVAIAGLVFLAQVARNTACLGENITIYSYPIIQALHLLDLSRVFSLGEIISMTVLVAVGFLKIVVAFYALHLAVVRLFALKGKAKSLLIPLAIILANLAGGMFGVISDITEFVLYIYPLWGVLFCVILPLASILRCKYKKKREERIKCGASA